MEPISTQRLRWLPVPDRASLHRAAADAILASAERAIRARGRFLLVLAGGDTPRGAYQLLRHADAAWAEWHIYFGDERCLPPEDPARNSRMADEAWLDHVAIPASQRHPIPAELGAEAGASAYAKTLHVVGTFDLVLLGLGEDGHTASLFPDHEWGEARDAPATLAVLDAPKPPPGRVSLSAHRLSDSREVLFLVSGESKRHAVEEWRAGKKLPASAIIPPDGVEVLIEASLLASRPG